MFKLPYMINCVEFENFILAYLEGDLSRHQESIFEMHMMLCAECQKYLQRYQASLALAKSAEATTVPTEVPEGLIRAVLAAHEAD
jgi:anti-sigma factor RsiW